MRSAGVVLRSDTAGGLKTILKQLDQVELRWEYASTSQHLQVDEIRRSAILLS